MRTINKARRGFLKLMPAAPLAATVAAKEAAATMGLSGPINAANAGLVGGSSLNFVNPVTDGTPWFVEAMKSFMSEEAIERDRLHAKGRARILDPDLAAMRSLSPAQAYAIQVERCFLQIRKENRFHIDQDMERWNKANPGAAFAQKVLGS